MDTEGTIFLMKHDKKMKLEVVHGFNVPLGTKLLFVVLMLMCPGPRTSVYFKNRFSCRIRLRNTALCVLPYGPALVN